MDNDTLRLEAKNFAEQIIAKKLTDGFKQEALHEYQDKEGNPVYWKIRLKHSDNHHKFIRPFWYKVNESGFVIGEPKFPNGKPVYHLPDIIENFDATIYITEGEMCADMLTNLGLTATTSGSWSSSKNTDWSPLNKRKVIIWPDADEKGLKYAEDVTKLLQEFHCRVSWVDIEKLNLSDKDDCVDWIIRQQNVTRGDIEKLPLILPEIACTKLENTEADLMKSKQSINKPSNYYEGKKSALLLEIVKDIEFFHDEKREPYATFKKDEHFETWHIENTGFTDWLSHQFWEKVGEPISDYALREALSIMRGKALHEGKCLKVFTRIGYSDGKYYIDLANKSWQVVEISQADWVILDKSPIKFRGLKNMKSLPISSKTEGDINLLWRHINVPEEQRILVLAWLLECLRPNIPFVILSLFGFQGCAKSTTQNILRSLIDPNVSNLRNPPKSSDDIAISASNNWLVSYNNVSHLSAADQDDLCNLATGSGFAKRELYTTSEESVVDIMRPVILNGISSCITAQDLLDRCIVIELPEIKGENRKTEEEIRLEFVNDYPIIFSGLLDLFVKVLKVLPEIKIKEKLRMADFCLLGTAIEKVLTYEAGTFMSTYKNNRDESMTAELYSSPVAIALIKFMHNSWSYKCTIGELYEKLDTLYRPTNMGGWPKSPHGLGKALRRQAIALEALGIKLNFNVNRINRGRCVEIVKKVKMDDVLNNM